MQHNLQSFRNATAPAVPQMSAAPAFGVSTGMPTAEQFLDANTAVFRGGHPAAIASRPVPPSSMQRDWYSQRSSEAMGPVLAGKMESSPAFQPLADSQLSKAKQQQLAPIVQYTSALMMEHELPPAPLFLEPRTHFSTASSPREVWTDIAAFFAADDSCDIEFVRPFQARGVANANGNTIVFCVELFRPQTAGPGCLLEFQRRSGCSVAACSLYKRLRAAVEHTPFVDTFSLPALDMSALPRLDDDFSSEPPPLPPHFSQSTAQSPSKTTTTTAASSLSGACAFDLDAALLAPLVNMIGSSTVEACTEGFSALSQMVCDEQQQQYVTKPATVAATLFTSFSQTLALVGAAVSSPDTTLVTHASCLLSHALAASPCVRALASQLLPALLDTFTRPDCIELRAAKRNIVRALLCLADAPANAPCMAARADFVDALRSLSKGKPDPHPIAAADAVSLLQIIA